MLDVEKWKMSYTNTNWWDTDIIKKLHETIESLYVAENKYRSKMKPTSWIADEA